MQKTSLYIPTPCHEDWNKMTPTQQGKFCRSCNKQVIDFSLMTDTQILNILSGQSGRLCGRFDTEQLQRPLIETKIQKKKSWWIALTMPLLFLFNRSEAQNSNKILSHASAVLPESEAKGKILVGKIRICEPPKAITIKGKVVDESGRSLAFASVMQKGKTHGTSADSAGYFSIDIKAEDIIVTIAASHVNYETTEKVINTMESEIPVSIALKQVTTSEAVVVEDTNKIPSVRLGGISVCNKITSLQKIDTAIRKALHISAFRIYPNPAIKGAIIQFEIKQAGQYQLQLLDSQSLLVTAENISANSNKSNISFPVPANIASGNYYLRLINEQTKKSFTEKLIIQ